VPDYVLGRRRSGWDIVFGVLLSGALLVVLRPMGRVRVDEVLGGDRAGSARSRRR
jgi:hypothetical protein